MKNSRANTGSSDYSSKTLTARLAKVLQKMDNHLIFNEIKELIKKYNIQIKFDDRKDFSALGSYSPTDNTIRLNPSCDDTDILFSVLPHETRHAWQYHAKILDRYEAVPQNNIILNRFAEADAYSYEAKFKAIAFLYKSSLPEEEQNNFFETLYVSDLDQIFLSHFQKTQDANQATQKTFVAFFDDSFRLKYYDKKRLTLCKKVEAIYQDIRLLIQQENWGLPPEKAYKKKALEIGISDDDPMFRSRWRLQHDFNFAAQKKQTLTQETLKKFGRVALDRETSINYLEGLSIPLTDKKFTGKHPFRHKIQMYFLNRKIHKPL